MKVFLGLLYFLTATWTVAADPLVTVHYGQSMRIPNHRVVVEIDTGRKLLLRTESKDGVRAETTVLLSAAAMVELRQALERTDWSKAKRDHVRGLDGAEVRIVHLGKETKLWSPGDNTEKRGLASVRDLLTVVFRLAGLDAAAMPVKRSASKPVR